MLRRRTWLVVIATSMTLAMAAPAGAGHEGELAHSGMANSKASFPTWYQGFNHGSAGWITDETSGEIGWCGDIETVRRGESDLSPSAGRAFATVSQGACNATWEPVFGSSGPYSFGYGFSDGWPASGFVYELDVHLDPDWPTGTSFTLAAAFTQPDVAMTGAPYRYLLITVSDVGDAVDVAGHDITDAGWYTLRYVFSSDSSQNLSVEFQLTDRGRHLHAVELDTTAFTGEPVSGFAVEGVGSGYLWFVSLSEGLELPIDEHRMHRGG